MNMLYIACNLALTGNQERAKTLVGDSHNNYFAFAGTVSDFNIYLAYMTDIAWTIILSQRMPDLIIKPLQNDNLYNPNMQNMQNAPVGGFVQPCNEDVDGLFIAPWSPNRGSEDATQAHLKVWAGASEQMKERHGLGSADCIPPPWPICTTAIASQDPVMGPANIQNVNPWENQAHGLSGNCHVHV